MPEAPELFLLREHLAQRIVGKRVERAEELLPIVVRNMMGSKFYDVVVGRSILDVTRRGKLLTVPFSGDVSMVVSPMLTGDLRLQYPADRLLKSTVMKLGLSDGSELRYIDPKRMGQIYLLPSGRTSEIVRLENQGPDVFDQQLSIAEFKESLRRYRGEVKGVLTRGQLVAGIGNAYADEILWDAGIFPFKRVTGLEENQIASLHSSVYSVPKAAVSELRSIFREVDGGPRKDRSIMTVHGRSGQNCPRCGARISSVKSRRIETNFCRKCQPGTMFG